MKCPSESAERLTSRLKVFTSSVYMKIDPGTSSVVASIVWLSFCLPFSGPRSQDFLAFSLPRAKEVFQYASPRICSSFHNREEPLAHVEKRFYLFLALQKVIMVLKIL